MDEPAPDHGPSVLPLPPKASTEETDRPTLPSRPNIAARHAKRLTLNFPIATPLNLRPEQASPSVATPATESSPRMMSPGQFVPEATVLGEVLNHEPTDLLTAIASQERKVLELKEELQKAEAELASLKKQWVRSERLKKQTEISFHTEAMRPIRASMDGSNGLQSPRNSEHPIAAAASTTTPIDTVPIQIRRSKELERRDSIRSAAKGEAPVSANGRRVFAGSKHTRTLSLLSPDMGVVKPPFPMPSPSDSTKSSDSQATRHPRSATLPSVDRADTSKTVETSDKPTEENWRRSMPPPSSEALLRTGRQMASDLREGLWTFLEDIRQATVGEEGISATRSRTLQPPTSGTARTRSGQRSERSVTPVRNRDQNGNSIGRTSSSSSLSKDASASRKTGNNNSSSTSPPNGTEVSFWSEFGVDTPGQKLKPKQTKRAAAVAASNTQNGQKESANSNQVEVGEEDDDWNNWDTPQQDKKSHTPSSSRSTVTSKIDQSPSTQLSSPRTSASFGERNTDETERPRTDNGIPWPALSKFTASQLTRTASSLMDEWEKSLTSTSSSTKAEHDDWETF
ncbi:hypothetical protein TMatcc_007201 [Talaromyces marneffei ATCC 18224]|uniref:DUF4048 domain-containing protein n=1 Tax=Talaromyces marneffei (strain ATCC 18224 / CBS 334.59 / QM 7333) TaxID=441960 RepID=B6QF91_TALMQ|nr:conserved hypothetical protein [Talaromyces marneffei ATCC 18224]KAE8553358.1 hypothetical protein EYB25_004740 [Talaromyces marneffei]